MRCKKKSSEVKYKGLFDYRRSGLKKTEAKYKVRRDSSGGLNSQRDSVMASHSPFEYIPYPTASAVTVHHGIKGYPVTRISAANSQIEGALAYI